jgi:hypothetical protein
MNERYRMSESMRKPKHSKDKSIMPYYYSSKDLEAIHNRLSGQCLLSVLYSGKSILLLKNAGCDLHLFGEMLKTVRNTVGCWLSFGDARQLAREIDASHKLQTNDPVLRTFRDACISVVNKTAGDFTAAYNAIGNYVARVAERLVNHVNFDSTWRLYNRGSDPLSLATSMMCFLNADMVYLQRVSPWTIGYSQCQYLYELDIQDSSWLIRKKHFVWKNYPNQIDSELEDMVYDWRLLDIAVQDDKSQFLMRSLTKLASL